MNSQLIVQIGNQIIKRVSLGQESCLVGRDKQCDLVLRDRTVSAEHARIFQHDFNFFVEDLGSTNGTYVNYHRIDIYPLQDGDVIRLGKHELLYQAEEIGLQRQLSKLALDPKQNKGDLKAHLAIMDGRKAGMVIKLDQLPLTLGESLSECIQITLQQNQWVLEHQEANGKTRREVLAIGDGFVFQGITFKLQQRS